MTAPADLPAPADFTFFETLKVRWGELDPQGIVFNPNYFVYFDIGVTEYFRAIGFAYPERLAEAGTDIFAVSAQANFRASATHNDVLRVGVRTALIGRSSLTLGFAIFRADDLLVDGTVVYVNAETKARRSAPLPAALIERILAYERTPPARK